MLKAGAAYLPLDTDHPAERTAFMLADSGAPVVLTQRRFADRITTGADVLALDDPDVSAAMPDGDPKPVVHPDSAAYLMYTSGSTGRPKGVLVPHRAIVSQLTWLGGRFPLRPDDRYLHHMSTSFDVSLMELFLPLTTGAGLVLARPGGHRDLAYLAGLVRDQRVTTMGLVPTALAELLRFLQDAGAMASIRSLRRHFTGGEALTGEFAARWRAQTGVPLYHFYGPTEATVQVTCWGQDDDPAVPAGARVPIGPLAGNVRARVLDERLREVPVATPGQLYVGGVQVARGYHGRPGLTARRFVADPYGAPGDRMYATGDLVRWNRDGRLEFLGRIDDQVKVRGFRIELGEIETVLREHPGVRDCAAAVKDGRLVAYVAGEVDTATLPATLERRLPDYMIPATFVELPELPRSPSGKLEPAALPAPDFAARSTAGNGRPATPAEDLFRRLFAEVLGLESVGTTDNFFDLGGDSIISLHLVSSARRAGMRISTRDVFQRKTPAGLAAVAEATGAADPAGEESGVGEVPLTPVMRWFDERGTLSGRYAQSVVVPVPAGLNGARLTAGLQAVLDRHGMLRARLVDGPCLEVREAGAVAAGGCVGRVDAAGLDAGALRRTLAEQGRAALDRLDPYAGEMVRAVWLDPGPGKPGHLLLVVHHLVVDGVSWRIIVPDLTAAWQAIAEGRAPELGTVLTSFGRWARLLAERARDEEELPLWTRVLDGPDPLLGRRLPDPRRDTVATLGRTSVTVPPERTAPLLAAAYGAGVHEVLLAGLTIAVARWRRARGVRHTALLVDVEGHGREPLTDDVDLSRTVGWFTAVHPVRLDPGEARDAGQVLKRVKEQLRALPRGGLGHGLLRHLNPRTAAELAAYAAPQIAFNYLGRFDTADAAGTVDLSGAWDDALPPTHTLEVTALVHADGGRPCLQLSLAWVPGALDEPDVADLADEWVAALDGIGAARRGRPHALRRAARLPDPRGSRRSGGRVRRRRRRVVSRSPIEDVRPLSPLQEGLFFHALYDDQDPGLYLIQLGCDVEGPLDPARLRASGQALLDRHANLRVGVPYGPGPAVQVVLRHVELPWREVDLSGSGDEAGEADRLAAGERGRRVRPGPPAAAAPDPGPAGPRPAPRRPDRPPHPDGRLVHADAAPRAVRHGRDRRAAPGHPVPRLPGLAGRPGQGRGRGRLAAHTGGRDRTHPGRPGRHGRGTGRDHRPPQLSERATAALRDRARADGLTLNTLVQGAWALTARHG